VSSEHALDDHRLVEAEYGVVREVEYPNGQGSPSAPSGRTADRTRVGPRRYGIEITIPGECDRCAIRGDCYGAGSRVWASSAERLEPGDQVRLEMRPRTILKATAWVYGIPLVSVLSGTLLGHRWLFASRPEEPRVLLSFALGAGMMILAGLLLARLNSWVGQRLTITARSLESGD